MKFLVKTKLSENISVTSEGFLLCKNVPLTHTGALRYAPGEHPFGDNVGEIIIRRSPEELFSEITMASFEGKDVTVQHPEEFVSPENYQDLTHGVLVNLRKGEKKIEVEGEEVEVLLGDLLIKSAEAIELVQSGEREVSLGYEAEWELEDGKTEGTHAKIKGNHCAIVSSGRAGTHCAITDSKKENLMNIEKFKKLFGKTVDEAVAEKEKEEEKKAKDAEEAAEKEKKEKEASDAEKLDKVVSDVAKLADAINALAEKISGKKEGEDESEEEEESKDDDVIVEEEEESSEDEESESHEGTEGEDSDEESEEKKKDKAGDTASRAEILSPGIDVKDKDVMVKALTAASKTTDGKKVIESLIGKKDIAKLPKEAIAPIFTAAAEMMKTKRVKDLSSTKAITIDSFPALKGTGTMTAEQINKQNAEFYSKKK